MTDSNSSSDTVEAFFDAHPEIDMFEVVLPDIAGGLRGNWITRDKLHTLFKGGLKLPVSALAFDTWGRDVEAWVFDSGDGDGFAQPDPRTLAPVPWAPGTGQVVISLLEPDRSPCLIDPRTLLSRLLQRFAALGLTPVVATEMEFYLLAPESDDLGRPAHTQADRVGGALGSGETYGIEAMASQRDFMRAAFLAGILHGIEEQLVPPEPRASPRLVCQLHAPPAPTFSRAPALYGAGFNARCQVCLGLIHLRDHRRHGWRR